MTRTEILNQLCAPFCAMDGITGGSKIAFFAGVAAADENPEWRDLAEVKPKDGQRMLALFKGGMMLPCYWREDGNKDAILHFADREVNLGPVKITHWLPIPATPNTEDRQ